MDLTDLILRYHTIRPTLEELAFLNQIVMPNSFSDYQRFDGSERQSLAFYQQFNLAAMLQVMDEILSVEHDQLISLSLQAGIDEARNLDVYELLRILEARIVYAFHQLIHGDEEELDIPTEESFLEQQRMMRQARKSVLDDIPSEIDDLSLRRRM